MRKVLNKYLQTTCCIILLMPMRVYATTSSTQTGMMESQWQQLMNDKAFSYKNEREYVIKETQKHQFFGDFWSNLLAFFSGVGGQILLWGILFAIVGYLVYYIVLSKNGSFYFSRTKKVKTAPEETTENLDDIARTDWENLVQESVKKGNYRHAVRYSYIRLLQLLQERELIAYRNDKTNFEYYNELSDTPYKPAFKQLSRQYEYAWYGHFAFAEDSFRQYMDEFNQLKKQLGR